MEGGSGAGEGEKKQKEEEERDEFWISVVIRMSSRNAEQSTLEKSRAE